MAGEGLLAVAGASNFWSMEGWASREGGWGSWLGVRVWVLDVGSRSWGVGRLGSRVGGFVGWWIGLLRFLPVEVSAVIEVCWLLGGLML